MPASGKRQRFAILSGDLHEDYAAAAPLGLRGYFILQRLIGLAGGEETVTFSHSWLAEQCNMDRANVSRAIREKLVPLGHLEFVGRHGSRSTYRFLTPEPGPDRPQDRGQIDPEIGVRLTQKSGSDRPTPYQRVERRRKTTPQPPRGPEQEPSICPPVPDRIAKGWYRWAFADPAMDAEQWFFAKRGSREVATLQRAWAMHPEVETWHQVFMTVRVGGMGGLRSGVAGLEAALSRVAGSKRQAVAADPLQASPHNRGCPEPSCTVEPRVECGKCGERLCSTHALKHLRVSKCGATRKDMVVDDP